MNKEDTALICELYSYPMLPLNEIARRVGCTPSTVTNVLDRVLKWRDIREEGTELVTIQSKINKISDNKEYHDNQ